MQIAAFTGLKRQVLTSFSMLFSSIGEQMRDAEFHYSNLIYGELCSQMAYLNAESTGNKSQTPHLVEVNCLNFLDYTRRYCYYATEAKPRPSHPLWQTNPAHYHRYITCTKLGILRALLVVCGVHSSIRITCTQ